MRVLIKWFLSDFRTLPRECLLGFWAHWWKILLLNTSLKVVSRVYSRKMEKVLKDPKRIKYLNCNRRYKTYFKTHFRSSFWNIMEAVILKFWKILQFLYSSYLLVHWSILNILRWTKSNGERFCNICILHLQINQLL